MPNRAVCLLLLLLAVLSVSAAAESVPEYTGLTACAPGEHDYTFIPASNSEYGVYLLGGTAEVTLTTPDGETFRGSGTGELFHAWLPAGSPCRVTVSGPGTGYLEITRNALSRCFANPLTLEVNTPRDKIITQPGDAHWYRLDSGGTDLFLTVSPGKGDPALSAMLFDSDGQPLSCFEELPDGACIASLKEPQGPLWIRVTGPDGSTGGYTLAAWALDLAEPAEDGDIPVFTVPVGSVFPVNARLNTEALLVSSEAPEIVSVQPGGELLALAEGRALITVFSRNGPQRCVLETVFVPLESFACAAESIHLSPGDTADIILRLTPENASQKTFEYSVDDPAVASVSAAGTVTGISEGETRLTVRNSQTGQQRSLSVQVTAPVRRYRALLIGEENYPFTNDTARRGTTESVEAIAGLLDTMQYDTAVFSISAAIDVTRAGLLNRIHEVFDSASGLDLSLIYITCHGFYKGEMGFLELTDGSCLALRDLERELTAISGEIVLFLDCCASGGAIGAASETYERTHPFLSGGFAGNRFHVLTSCALDEDSLRVAFDDGIMTTVFTRALCDAAGWNIEKQRSGAMNADTDYDGCVTLDELARYMSARVGRYVSLASGLTGVTYTQSVQAQPESDPLILFMR